MRIILLVLFRRNTHTHTHTQTQPHTHTHAKCTHTPPFVAESDISKVGASAASVGGIEIALHASDNPKTPKSLDSDVEMRPMAAQDSIDYPASQQLAGAPPPSTSYYRDSMRNHDYR